MLPFTRLWIDYNRKCPKLETASSRCRAEPLQRLCVVCRAVDCWRVEWRVRATSKTTIVVEFSIGWLIDCTPRTDFLRSSRRECSRVCMFACLHRILCCGVYRISVPGPGFNHSNLHCVCKCKLLCFNLGCQCPRRSGNVVKKPAVQHTAGICGRGYP